MVAMILPFSVMGIADAAPNENADDKAKEVVDSLSIPNAERDLKLADGQKLFPGQGWVKADVHSKAPAPIFRDNPNNPGEQILDIDTMIKKSEESKITETSGDIVQDFLNALSIPLAEAADGYNQIVHKDSSSNDFTYHRAYWDVPAAPSSYSGGTNFSFPAVQPATGSNIIFQPVLQHGWSSVCDSGNDFDTYALILVAGSAYHTPCTDADPGERIRGTLSESNNVWTVAVRNYGNSAANDSYSVYYSGQMDFGALAVETYDLGSSCSKLQGDVEFDTVTNTGDVDSWVTAGSGQFCGMTETIVSDSNVEFFNNN